MSSLRKVKVLLSQSITMQLNWISDVGYFTLAGRGMAGEEVTACFVWWLVGALFSSCPEDSDRSITSAVIMNDYSYL
jgi:hypothetical protein